MIYIRSFLSLLMSMIIILSIYSQAIYDTCFTVERTDYQMEALPWYGNNQNLEDFLDSVDYYLENDTFGLRNSAQCGNTEFNLFIPIRFWFYRDSDTETGLPNDLQIQQLMDELNRLYQESGVTVTFFAVCPQYITDSDAVIMDDWQAFWNDIGSGHTDPWAVNVHVVRNYQNGTAAYFEFGDFIITERDIYIDVLNGGATTLAHEIGHFFGLEHPHRNYDKGKCRQEAVDRNRTFTFGQFFTCLKTGKICDKNGDALCDTDADPLLSNKVDAVCLYTMNEIDEWGDFYNPNTRNIMSYSRRGCRDHFSRGQSSILYKYMIQGRGYRFYLLDYNEIDPDEYEPDDSDFPDVPRLISLGETQCHSFHNINDCQDQVDWLRVDNINGVVESYVIEIDDLLPFDNPVEEVKTYNTDINGVRTSEIIPIFSQQGTIRIYEVPCSEILNDLLIEVVRNEQKEGKYSITLRNKYNLYLSNTSTSIVCQGDNYEIINLPTGATINWSTSTNIALSNSTGISTAIISYTPSSLYYWIQATITYGGCQMVLFKEFEGADIPISNFEIVKIIEACYPPTHPYGRYTTEPHTEVEWEANYGEITVLPDNSVMLEPSSTGWITLSATAQNDCGSILVVTEDIYIEECQGCIKKLEVSPNPTTIGQLNISLEKEASISGSYHLLITNIFGELKHQSERSTDNFVLDVSNYGDGQYWIHVYLQECYRVETFIIY